MQAINFLKPNRDNIKNYSIIGSVLILISLIDVISNAFLKTNLTSFLHGSLKKFRSISAKKLSAFVVNHKGKKEATNYFEFNDFIKD